MYNNKKIIVTLTSNRCHRLDEVIDKLFNQTLHVDKIYINIPHENKISESLTNYLLENDYHKRVIINRCDDYGPITKLIPTLLIEKNDDFLFIIDDDMLLEFNALNTLLQKLMLSKQDYALSYSGWNFGSKFRRFQAVNANFYDEEVDCIQLIILVKPNYFDLNQLLKYDKGYEELFFKNDDHWISYNLAKRGIKRISINQNSDDFIKYISYEKKLKFVSDTYQIGEYLQSKGIYVNNSRYGDSICGYFISIILLILIYYLTKNYKLLLILGFIFYKLAKYGSFQNLF